MGKVRPWTAYEDFTLRSLYKAKTKAEIAAIIGRSVSAIEKRIYILGIGEHKMGRPGIEWTDKMISTLKTYYPVTFTYALAKMMGISRSALISKANELGVTKAENFRELKRADYNAKRRETCRKQEGCKTHWIKKGEHRSPETEFKKGAVLDPDMLQRRTESIRAYYKRKRVLEKYGLTK